MRQEANPAGLARELRDRLRSRPDGRLLIGLAGAPGSGKSTLARRMALQLGPELCAVVPMDGFHLANAQLTGTPREHRKGAIDTFDGDGYLALLRRIRARSEETVYAPEYVRGLEEPIAGSIAVVRSVPIVLTEGNYLLADASPWRHVRETLDEVWFVETPHVQRRERLIERHVRSGMDRDAATAWADGPDQANAQLVATTRNRADRVLTWP